MYVLICKYQYLAIAGIRQGGAVKLVGLRLDRRSLIASTGNWVRGIVYILEQ